MAMITDRQLDIALRYALQNCFEEEIEEMDEIDPVDYQVNIKTEKRFKHTLNKALRKDIWSFTIPKTLKGVAVIILVTATVLFCALMATPPVRAAVWDVIITWYDRYVGVLYNQEEDTPRTINSVILPPELPDGWRIETITTNNAMVEHLITAQDNSLLFLSQIVLGEEELWVDNTNSIISSIEISCGVYGQLFQYDDGITLVWENQYVFVVRGNIDDKDNIILLAKMMFR